MFNVGPGELIAILALALIVLGPQRLPEAVRTVGRVVGELRRISSGFQDELRNALDDSEVERDLDRLRAKGDGSDGEGQRELPLDDQPELPLGAVQYPTGVEPIDVDTDETPKASAPADGSTDSSPADATLVEPAAIVESAPPLEPAEPVEPAELVEPGEPDVVDVEEPGKNPSIDDDPDEPYEPPTAGGGGERALS